MSNKKVRVVLRINLKDARQKKGMTQADVAQYLGMKTTSYQRIEAGTRKGDIDLWDKLEDLFGMPQRQLREKSLENNTEE